MFQTFKITALASTLVCLSACATTRPALEPQAPSFGQAVNANTNAQHVKPTPAQKANRFIPANRTRNTLARKRYSEDTVEKPIRPSTTN